MYWLIHSCFLTPTSLSLAVDLCLWLLRALYTPLFFSAGLPSFMHLSPAFSFSISSFLFLLQCVAAPITASLSPSSDELLFLNHPPSFPHFLHLPPPQPHTLNTRIHMHRPTRSRLQSWPMAEVGSDDQFWLVALTLNILRFHG